MQNKPKRTSVKSKRRDYLWLYIALIFFLLSLIVFWPVESNSNRIRLKEKDSSLVAQGKIIYRMHCASCHGNNLEGQPNWKQLGPDGLWPAPPHDDSGHTWHHSDNHLINTVKKGVVRPNGMASKMPAFSEVLTDDEIIAVLSFIKRHWSPSHQAAQEGLTTRRR